MLAPIIKDGIGAYGIGEKLRALRLKRKLGLVELGRHTGLSPAMLSKLERGKMFPALPWHRPGRRAAALSREAGRSRGCLGVRVP